jgi:hypothetical protein
MHIHLIGLVRHHDQFLEMLLWEYWSDDSLMFLSRCMVRATHRVLISVSTVIFFDESNLARGVGVIRLSRSSMGMTLVGTTIG